MNSGEGISVVSKCYADVIQESFEEGLECDFLLGPAYKGIPLAASVAYELAERGVNKRYGFDIKEEDSSAEISAEDVLPDTVKIVGVVMFEEIPMNGKEALEFAEQYASNIFDTLKYNEFDSIFAKAYGGIVPATLILKKLFEKYKINKRWGYNRKRKKVYGDKSEITVIGDIRKDDRVLVFMAREKQEQPVIGYLRKKDVVSQVEDVITTGDTKIEVWKKLKRYEEEIFPGCIYLGFDRQERTKDGRSPVEVVEAEGWKVKSILQARPVFVGLHNKEINGKILVDDKILEEFIEYQAKYGV